MEAWRQTDRQIDRQSYLQTKWRRKLDIYWKGPPAVIHVEKSRKLNQKSKCGKVKENETTDAHRLKSRGGGTWSFWQNPQGVKAFRKNCLGGSPISGFIAFLLTSVLKFPWGGPIITNPPSPSSPPHVHLWTTCSQGHTINNERGIVSKSRTIINKVFFGRKILQIDIIKWRYWEMAKHKCSTDMATNIGNFWVRK